MSERAPERPAWWHLMQHAALKDTQGSYWSAAMASEQISGRNTPRVIAQWDRYREHVRRFGFYDVPRWRTR